MYQIFIQILIIIFLIMYVLVLGVQAFDYSEDNLNHMPYPDTSQLHHENVISPLSPPKPGWVDPFDILAESRSQDALFVQSEVEIHVLKKQCKSYEVYLRRFVNMFLSAVDLKNKPITDSQQLIKIEFIINDKDIATLQEFGKEANNDKKIEYVDEVFSRIFSQKTLQDEKFSFNDFVVWIQKVFAKIIVSPEWTVLSSVLLLLFMTLWVIFHTHSYRLAMSIALITIFFAGFGFTWIRMYEEKEIERFTAIELNGQVPKHCSKESQTMVWYEHMYYRMFGVDCREFLKMRDVRPLVKISPIDVFSETISSMVLTPAKRIGVAYGKFVKSFLDELPWWLHPLALPFSLLVPIGFITVLLAFLFSYRLSLSITGFHLLPTWAHTSQNRVGNESKYVEDCSCKHVKSCQGSSNIPSVETPLFFMNYNGLKKLSSGTLLDVNGKSKNKQKETPKVDGKSIGDECEKMKELREFEEFVDFMETKRLIEECKEGKSIPQGENSLRNRKDPQETPMLENHDLKSFNTNETPLDRDAGKDKSA